MIFDFDKTLVGRDSFRLFGHIGASGPVERALLVGYAVASKLGLISNGRYKELVLGRVWLRRTMRERAALLDAVRDALRAVTVAPTVEALQSHIRRGDVVAVLTASPEFYVTQFLAEISEDVDVRGSAVVESGDRVRVDNLYGERKAVAAAELIVEIGAGTVHVYTDHADDLALMKLADMITLVDPPQSTIAAADRAGLTYEILAT